MITSFKARSISVLFGPGASLQTGSKLKESGINKVLCMYDAGIEKAGIAKKVTDNLKEAGITVVTFSEVITDVPDNMVDEVAELAKAEKVEAIMGLGGGSSLDAAKAVNILMGNEPPISRYMMGKARPQNLGLPLFLIPTTSGTGSELTWISVVTDTSTNIKKGVVGRAGEATLAIVDPELTLGLPPAITAFTGMDAFSHSVEALTSKKRNPMSDTLAEKAITLILESLPKVLVNGQDIDLRSDMSFAALIAGAAFSDAIVHLGHSIAHTLGAMFNIPHGIGCAISLPAVIEYVADAVPEKVRRVGLIMGLSLPEELDPDTLGKLVAKEIRSFSRSVGIPSFREASGQDALNEETLGRIADIALADSCTIMSPKTPSKEDVIAMVLRATYPDS